MITQDSPRPTHPSPIPRHTPPGAAAPTRLDADRLAAELRRLIKGEVRFDDGSKALYSTDSSNYRQVPIGVVVPRTIQDVVETVAVCRQFDALDLCLSCKGCKGECPVNVDMATYKAEFLAHYYAGRLRPRHAYAFGLIMYWARLAERMPGLVNFITQTPGLSGLAKAVAGMAPRRRIPAFAAQTFKQWFNAREARNPGAPEVILWPDTFNDHFHPDTARAAVEVLEAAGWRVRVPAPWLCCGRPLYDYGMLGLARRQLQQILDTLHDEIRRGVPIVVLEPSCAAVFRDELRNLFPRDLTARRLYEQTFLLSEFLERKAPDLALPTLARKAVVHGHCHHKALMGLDAEEAVLKRLGLDFQVLDSGCCGMAGAFGFEAGEHYEVSLKAGERVLLPAVRQADPETLVIANGFSCREQIAQTTDRRALHLAQVVQQALQQGGAASDVPPPAERQRPGNGLRTAALVGAGAALAAAAVGLRRRR